MTKTIGMRGLQLLAGSALLMFASLSHAQFVWVDAKGVKQFSDRGPGSDIPRKNILKSPNGLEREEAAEAAQPAAAKIAPNASVADREADYRKRQVEKAEQEKKAAKEQAVAAQTKLRCETARVQKAQLDTGIRIRSGADGSFMDDAQRAKANADTNRALQDCK